MMRLSMAALCFGKHCKPELLALFVLFIQTSALPAVTHHSLSHPAMIFDRRPEGGASPPTARPAGKRPAALVQGVTGLDPSTCIVEL
jgi:hypothetical protein